MLGGILSSIALASGFVLTGDADGPEHELHWVSHLMGTPAGLAVLGGLAGVLFIERRALRFMGTGAILLVAVAVTAELVGGTLVGWAGGVQKVVSGGLYDRGHHIGDVAAIAIPAQLVLSAVIIRRALVLPRWSGWLPFLSLPLAAYAGALLGAIGRDGGTALTIFLGAMHLQFIVWGCTMVLVRTPGEEQLVDVRPTAALAGRR